MSKSKEDCTTADLDSDIRRLAHLMVEFESKSKLLFLILDSKSGEKAKSIPASRFFRTKPTIINILGQIPEVQKAGGISNLTIGGICHLKKDDLTHFGMSDSDIQYLEKRLATKSLFLSK